jgi:hypothetical protein
MDNSKLLASYNGFSGFNGSQVVCFLRSSLWNSGSILQVYINVLMPMWCIIVQTCACLTLWFWGTTTVKVLQIHDMFNDLAIRSRVRLTVCVEMYTSSSFDVNVKKILLTSMMGWFSGLNSGTIVDYMRYKCCINTKWIMYPLSFDPGHQAWANSKNNITISVDHLQYDRTHIFQVKMT